MECNCTVDEFEKRNRTWNLQEVPYLELYVCSDRGDLGKLGKMYAFTDEEGDTRLEENIFGRETPMGRERVVP